MKKLLLPFFIILIIIFGTVVAFLATPEKETKKADTSNSSKILYFYSDTCHYCIEQKPILEELEKEGVEFERMNVGEHEEYWTKYGISGTPSFIFKDKKLTGYQSKESIRNLWGEK